MATITRTIGKIWDEICDKSDMAIDLDSLVRTKTRPIEDAIWQCRESRRIAKIDHWSY